jgi:creatinine amidohydrolase
VSQRFLFHELTREELGRRARDGALAIMPTGATEQHGPHLPVGTDTFAVEHIVRTAASRLIDWAPLIVTPTLPFGSSAHHLPFGGTMSLSTQTYYAVIRDLVESLITDGFGRILIVNGHGGNHELVQLVARDVALDRQADIGAGSYWQAAKEHLDATGSPGLGRTPGHAGHFETSLVMALEGELVVEPRPARTDDPSLVVPIALSQRVRVERHGAWQHFDGFTDSPATASADRGELYLEAAVSGVAAMIEVFLEATR